MYSQAPPSLPMECIEEIVLLLRPLQRYTVSFDFGLHFIQRRHVPLRISVVAASAEGNLEALEAFKKRRAIGYIAEEAIESASYRGQAKVLDWWHHYLSPWMLMEPPPDVFDIASRHGHVSVLTWWLRWFRNIHANAADKCYSSDAMDLASANGHIDVLRWWKRSGLTLKWTCQAMELARQHGHMDVIKWWNQSGLKLK